MGDRAIWIFCVSLMLVGSPVHALQGGGVNMYLQRVWWQSPPPGVENYASLSQENRHRIGVAAAEGFKLVRIMFKMSLVGPEAPESQRESALRLMTEFVSEANKKGMKAIVTLTGDETSNKSQLICKLQDVLDRTLKAVAEALPDNPSAGIETLNEPPDGCGPQGGPGSWPVVQLRLYHQIRAVRPHISIIVAGGGWGTLDGLVEFDPKSYVSDLNVLFSFHYYEPFLFTSQGSSMIFPGCYKYVHGLGWPYDGASVGEVKAEALRRISGDRGMDKTASDDCRKRVTDELSRYEETGTRDFVVSRFDLVAGWASKNGVTASRIFVGEFGVLRSEQKSDAHVRLGAAQWLKAIVDAASDRNFLWAIFDLDTTYAINCGHTPNETICEEYLPALR